MDSLTEACCRVSVATPLTHLPPDLVNHRLQQRVDLHKVVAQHHEAVQRADPQLGNAELVVLAERRIVPA